MPLHRGNERRCSRLEPISGDRQPRPFCNLRAGLGEQLAFGVRGCNDPSINAGIDRPFDDHADGGGFSDAVTRRHRNAAWMKPRLWVGKMIANNAHHPPLPFTRAISPNKITSAPREGVKRIAFRISREAAYVTCEGYFERFSLRCHVRAGAPLQSQL